MGFSRQEYWSGLPCPPSRDLPNPGIRTQVSRTAGSFFTDWATSKALPFLNSSETPISLLHWTSRLSCPLDPPCPSCCIHLLIHPIAQCMLSTGGLTDELDVLISRIFFFSWWAFLAFWIFSSALKCEMSPVHWNSPLFSMYFPLARTSILLPLLSYSIPLHNFCLAGLLERALE